MKVTIFYRPDSEHARTVEEFVHEFGRIHPDAPITLLDIDSVEGGNAAAIYDIVQYPTVLALSNDGTMLQRWDNGLMPLMGELAYYANQ